MFEAVPVNPPDAIFGLNEQFKNDTSNSKVNLTVGVYKDANGQTPTMTAVKQAEKILLETSTTKSYLPIDGSAAFRSLVAELILGAEDAEGKFPATAQTPGGTVALRVAGELVKRILNVKTIWMSNPTWANHSKIFTQAGLEIQHYGYLDQSGTGLDFDKVTSTIEQASAGDAVLLHTVCHNPTGVDLSEQQWQTLSELILNKSLVPIFDFAYQGFGESLESDAFAIRHFVKSGGEAIICNSFSKNFGLYGERVGGITAVAQSAAACSAMQSQIKSTIRTMYSNPPIHGGAIVETILADAELRKTWKAELTSIRQRIVQLRASFVSKMEALVPGKDFSYINQQRGMFSYSGLNKDQADRLREEHSIYILGSGRINIAGMNDGNMDQICNAIAKVL
jgi:aspartate/tyrosine/aromatic aminotransferase